MATTHSTLERLETNLDESIGARRAERAVLRVVDQVLQDRASMLGMLTLRDYDDHSLIHAVNVSILSVALGDHLGFSKGYLFELGFAALFHDIGKPRTRAATRHRACERDAPHPGRTGREDGFQRLADGTLMVRDYRLGETRVVSNPRGYPGQNGGSFDPGLVLEI